MLFINQTVDSAATDAVNKVSDLTEGGESPTLPTAKARRDALEGSVFWPELGVGDNAQLDPKLVERADEAAAFSQELSRAVTDGFPIPPALKARVVYKAALALEEPEKALQAAELIRRLAIANSQPNQLPEQVRPEGDAPGVNVVNNVQVNIAGSEGGASATVPELLREFLTLDGVAEALDADAGIESTDYSF